MDKPKQTLNVEVVKREIQDSLKVYYKLRKLSKGQPSK